MEKIKNGDKVEKISHGKDIIFEVILYKTIAQKFSSKISRRTNKKILKAKEILRLLTKWYFMI